MSEQSNRSTGISNRETAAEEAKERAENPPTGDTAAESEDRTAQSDAPAPSSQKVAGAFGKESSTKK